MARPMDLGALDSTIIERMRLAVVVWQVSELERAPLTLVAANRAAHGLSGVNYQAYLGMSLEQVCPEARGQAALVAVNRSYARSETVLAHGDEVAIIPPVAGG